MGDKINKEYEDFQKYLNKKDKKLKLLVKFDLDENIEDVLKELNNREIILCNLLKMTK
jgi:hypothetical protein